MTDNERLFGPMRRARLLELHMRQHAAFFAALREHDDALLRGPPLSGSAIALEDERFRQRARVAGLLA